MASVASGAVRSIELLGDTLYVVDNLELQLFDVSDPAHPFQLGTLLLVQGDEFLTDVAATAGFAHVVSTPLFPGGPASLRAVDTSVPQFPKRTILDTPQSPVLEVAGAHLYAVHVGGVGLGVYDLADPLAPSLVGSAPIPVAPPPAAVRDLEVIGDTACVAQNSILAIFDVADSAQPQLLTSIASAATALTHRGNLLYVGTAGGALEIYDVSNPTAPVLRGSLSASILNRVFDLDLAGNVLYMTQGFGIRAVDVSVASVPHELDVLPGPANSMQTTAVAGDLLYVGSASFQLRIIDAGNPTDLAEIASIAPFTGSRDLEVLGDRLYAAGGGGLLQVHDLSLPTAPKLMGQVIAGNEVDLANGIAYVGSTSGLPITAIDFGPEYAPTPQELIDVAPNNPFNRINLTANGFVMVALLGSEDLDVAGVDQGTLAFGPAGAPALLSTTSDANQDAHPDLFALFKVAQTGIAISDTQACLSGETVGGKPFEGCDAIQPIAGCGGGFAVALLVPVALPLGRAVARRRRAARA